MLRDVSMPWNSTFDMLEFAIKYQKAIDSISADCEMELQQFELSEYEWKIAIQLQDILKVCHVTVHLNVQPRTMHFLDGNVFNNA